MKFKRINVDTVRCLISEEELTANGLEVDDFLTNDGKTDNFLRKMITRAEEEVGYKVQGGNISIQVSVLPEHIIALTFSEKPNGGIMNMLENLKSAVENLSKTGKEETDGSQDSVLLEEQKSGDQPEETDGANKRTGGSIPIMDGAADTQNSLIRGSRLNYQLQFDSLDIFGDYCNAIKLEMPVENSLYKLKKEHSYFLLMKKEPMDDRQLCRLLGASLEFGSGIYSHDGIGSYILEHGECILPDHAIQTMQEI